jgi:diguanylate cyclase (GGDEF)-like protein
MSEIDDALTGSGSEIDAALGPTKAKSGIIRRAVGDTGISLLKGAISVPEALVGLADIPTGGAVGKAAEEIGFRPGDAKRALDTYLSPEQQAANEALARAEGFGETITTAVQNPSTIFHAAAESAPSMLGGGALARAAMKAVPRLGPITASAMGEGAFGAGATASSIREQTPDGTLTPEQAGLALASGAATGAITRAGGAIAKKLGIADVDTLVAGGGGAASSKGILRRMAEGAVAEGALEELPQSAQEQIAQNLALGRPWNEGVPEAAAMGMLVGGLIGGGAAGAFTGEAAPASSSETSARGGEQQPSKKISLPGDHPEITPAAGPISAAARTAIDTGASAQEQTKAMAVEAEEHQQQAAKGKFGPDEEAKALMALERQRDDDIKAMRTFTDPSNKILEDPEVAAKPRQFPFANAQAAARQAVLMEKKSGKDHEVLPHPTQPGKWMVQPKGAKPAKAAPAAQEAPAAAPAPAAATTAAAIDTRAHEAATSPQNELPEPTEAQAEAGNYKKGHARIGGLDLSIENPQGSKRRPEWPELKSHYGYIRGTVGKDKDHVDAFIKPGTPDDFAGTVYVVDQETAGGDFDEHKVMLGYGSMEEAEAAYRENYTPDWDGMGAISAMAMDDFKAWVRDPEKTKQRVAGDLPTAAPGDASIETEGQETAAAENLQATTEEGADARAVEGEPAAAPADADGETAESEIDAALEEGAADRSEKAVRELARTDKLFKAILKSEDPGAHTWADPSSGPAGSLMRGYLDAKEGRPFDDSTREPRNPNYRPGTFNPIDYYRSAYYSQKLGKPIAVRVEDEDPSLEQAPPPADPAPARGERRKDREQRTRVAEMSPEEMRVALLTDDLTGLRNGRALKEDLAQFSHVVAFDADSLKWVNDTLGHESGDQLLKAWGRAIAEATENGYRKSGDEFFALAASQAEAQTIAARVEALLSQAEITAVTPDGERITIKGIGASYGIGKDLKDADDRLTAAKRERELAGKRAGRGEEPPGVRREPPARVEDRVGEAADGQVDGDRPVRDDQPGDVQPPADAVAEPDAAAAAEPDAAGDLERGPAEPREESGRGEFALAAPDQLRPGAQPGGDDGGRKPAPRRGGSARARGASAQVPLLDLASNFEITDELEFKGVGAKSKYKNNVAAIRLLKQLESESRAATPAEQSVLARYVGWGGIPQAFDEKSRTWAAEFEELRQLLTDEEYAAARRSTQDAHYTAREVVQAMWGAVRRMGFNHGAVLEPSMGTGNFFGLMPRELARSRLTGVELDSITGRIAKQLYPKANVQVMGFNEIRLAPESFDLAIGNPPFGNQSVHDKQHPDLSKFSIHNFFFAKSVDALRPGGVLAMVVSNSFMDAQTQTARAWIAERARLLGAVRLPNTAFMANAGTEVTTDIVFLQKLGPREQGNAADWVSIGTIPDPAGGEAIPLNRYFMAHPEMLLGNMERSGTMYAKGMPALIAREGDDLGAQLRAALDRLPADVYKAGKTVKEAEEPANRELEIPPDLRPYNHFADGDRIMIKTPSLNGKDGASPVELDGRALERMKGMIGIRDAVRGLLRAEASEESTDAHLATRRKRLNAAYDAFVKANGYLNSDVNKRVFRDDADYSLLISLEKNYDKGVSLEQAKKHGLTARKPSAERADIFEKRVLYPSRQITKAGTAKEAMVATLNERGFIDPEYMAGLYGKSVEATIAELGELVYESPEGGWETEDAYLAGNVKAKLAKAKEAAARDAKFRRNVTALEAVQPKDIPAGEIFVRLGSSWVTERDYGDFARETFEGTFTGNFVPAVGQWMVQIRSDNAALATNKWGTPRMPAGQIMAALMANHQVAVYDVIRSPDGDKRVLNPEETAAAQGKADALAEAFQDWIWKEADRRTRLARFYNDRFNTNVDRKYDGSHMTFPGMTRTIELRPHQKNAIYRALQTGVVLLDHVVGAGKTFVKAAIAVEGRRIGLHRKPVIAVPNHLVEQWAKDIKKLYPGANVLAASRKDFVKDRRKALFAKIATGDWDAVIVAHKSFGFIPMPAAAERAILEEQMADLETAVQEARGRSNKKDLSIKQLEKLRDRIKAKIEALADRKQDDLLDFGELGVDALIVDEAHEFKNLFYSTTMQGVAGLSNPEGSIRAFDMFVKTRYVMQRNGDRGVYFGTGTPVSNSIAETFHMQRYLQFKALKERDIHTFDAWASTFGQAVTDWEMDAAGRYRQKTRFSKFANLGELRGIWREVTDIVTRGDLIRDAEGQGKRFPLPKVKGGKPQNVVVERSPEQAEFIGIPRQKMDPETGQPMVDKETGQPVMYYDEGTIVERLENWKSRVKENPREMPLVITGEARKAGLDMRLIRENAPDFPGSKVNEAARRIAAIWRANDHRRGTQLVFIDLSTPKAHKGKATAAAAAKVPTFFVRMGGSLEHVAGVKTRLSAAPDLDFFSVKDRSDFVLYVTATGRPISRGRTKQDAVDAANAYIGKVGREAVEKEIAEEAIPQEQIDAYITQWEEAQAKKDDTGEEEGPEEQVSLDDLLADQGGEFSVYDDLRKKLIDKGVPAEQIAFVHDYDTDIQKAKLFDAVNNGDIRVLLGSTMKMGAGTNVQRKLVAEHNLDAPWKPADLEQREGRILRQGNEFYEQDPDGFEIEILRYATKQTYDSRMWEIIERKAAAIEAFRTAAGARELEDVSSESANAAEMKAGASGNPLILEEIQLRQQVKKLETQRKAFERGKWDLQDMIKRVDNAKGYPWTELTAMKAAKQAVAPKPKDEAPLGLRIERKTYDDKKNLPITTIAAEIVTAAEKSNQKETIVGEYRGFPLTAEMWKTGSEWRLTLRLLHGQTIVGATQFLSSDKWSATGLVSRLDNIADGIDNRIAILKGEIDKLQHQAVDAARELGTPFPHEKDLADLKERHQAILQELRASAKKPPPRDLTAEGAQSRLNSATGPSGLPSFWNEAVALARPRLAETQPIDKGLRRMAFDILDTPTYKKAVAEFVDAGVPPATAKVRAAARAKVGMTLLDLRGTEIAALYNIEIDPSRRGKGHGQAAVAAMLESQDAPIHIIDIQQDAVAFWVKLGAQFPRSNDYMEARLDRFQYATYQAQHPRPQTPGRNVGTGAQGARAAASGTDTRVQGQQPGPGRDTDDLDFTGAALRAPTRAGSTPGQVRAWLARPLARMGVPVEVVASIEEMRAVTGLSLEADTAGVAHLGRIVLNAGNIRDQLHAEQALFHEAFHVGLRGAFRRDIEGYERAVRAVAELNENVRGRAAVWDAQFGADARRRYVRDHGMDPTEAAAATEVLAIEEALADLSGQARVVRFRGLRALVAAVQQFLRRAGFRRLAEFLERATDAEALGMILSFRDRTQAAEPMVFGPDTQPAYMRDAPLTRVAPLWYSELATQVAALKTESAPAAQWIGTLKGLKGVKVDEIEWSGVLDWLKSREDVEQDPRVQDAIRPGGPNSHLRSTEWVAARDRARAEARKVTKAEVLAFLEQNGVKVEETMLTDDGSDTTQTVQNLVVQLDALGYDVAFDMEGERVDAVTHRGSRTEFYPQRSDAEAEDGFQDLPPNVRALVTRMETMLDGARDQHPASTKFQNYTLPGGQNYRELLLTLPPKASPEYARFEAIGKKPWNDRTPQENEEYRALGMRGDVTPPPQFRSSHFDQPNILAHVRFDERTDADGKRVLFIEEFQSDWAQKGKREGFADPAAFKEIEAQHDKASKDMLAAYEKARPLIEASGLDDNELFRAAKRQGLSVVDENLDLWPGEKRDVVKEYLRLALIEDEWETKLHAANKGIPKAPFVGKTEAWVALAVKRMIRYAVDNGFERVAWTTGEQQADRYDLSKRVSSIRYMKNGDGTYRVGFIRTGRASEWETMGNNVAEKDLADHVGKDLADKIISDAGEPIPHTVWKRFDGGDLKVGGEGMKVFYDRIVPNVINDVLKKLGGGRVGKVNLSGSQSIEDEFGTEDNPDGREHPGGKFQEIGAQPGFDITPALHGRALEAMPVFSRIEAMAAPDFARRVRTEAANLWESSRTFNAFHRTVGTQQHKAKVDQDFGRVFELGQTYLQDVAALANEPADMAPDVLPMIRDLKDAMKFAKGANKADLGKVAEAIFAGTLEDRVYSTAELEDRGLTEKQIAQYRQVREAIDRSLDQLATSEAARLSRRDLPARTLDAARNTPENGPDIIANSLLSRAEFFEENGDAPTAARLRSIASDVEAKGARVRELKGKGYAPLMRFGQYTVYVTEQTPGGDTKQVYFGLYESNADANRAAKALRAEFPEATVTEGVLSQEAYRLFQGVTPDTLELFGDMVTVGPDGRKVKIGETEIFQQYLRLAVNNRSAMKRLIKRKGIEGFSQDVSRVLAQFLTSNARAAAGNYHMGDMLEAVESIPKEKGDVKDEAVRLMRYLQDPQEEASKLRGLLFVQYLGGSIASALTNMTQPILMSFPYLAQWGARRAASALTDAALTAAGTRQISDGELKAAVERAEKDGVIAPQEIHQLQAEAIRGFGSSIHLRRGLALWGSLFSLAEQFNRKSTFIAAWRMAKQDGVADPFAFAEEAVKQTQGIYNRGNRPNWARGAVGATLFTFKQFSIAYVEFLKRLPPKQRALALAILVLAAGMQGLPFADDLDDIIDTIAQSLGYSWNTKQAKREWLASVLGEGFAGFVLHGASAIPGVPLDVQGRLGLGNLLPGTALFKRSEPDKGRDLVEALGPAGGLAQSLAEGVGKAQAGDFGGALGSAAPLAIRNALKGLEMAQMGMYRDTRGRRVMDTDAYDAFIKGVGFQPAPVAAESRRIREASQNVRLAREVEAEIADRWATGIFEGDGEKVAKAIESLRAWNDANPEARIGIVPAQIQRRVREMQLTRSQRAMKAAPRELRPALARDLLP